MKCVVLGTLKTGEPCTNEATTVNHLGHHVCAECLAASDMITQMIIDLAKKLGQPNPYPKFDGSRN